jgi:predicted lipoprotein
MTIVILVMLSLVGTGVFSARKIGEWQQAREAGEVLRTVHTAQRMFLADNPTTLVANITAANIIPYLPNNATAMPTVKSLTGATLPIIVNQSPPVINAGSGVTYDPSGSNNDSLWDVGK